MGNHFKNALGSDRHAYLGKLGRRKTIRYRDRE